jgi:hypothetical protein
MKKKSIQKEKKKVRKSRCLITPTEKKRKKEQKRVLGVFILPLACGNVLLRVTIL